MADADDLIAVSVYNFAQAVGEPVTSTLAKGVINDLLTHPAECKCGHCEAAAIARLGDVCRVALSWQRFIAATRRRDAR